MMQGSHVVWDGSDEEEGETKLYYEKVNRKEKRKIEK